LVETTSALVSLAHREPEQAHDADPAQASTSVCQRSEDSMEKATAINLLGGTVRSAATLLNLSTQAVRKWPDEGCVARQVCDRVLAHVVREAIKKDPSLRTQLRLPADALRVPHEPTVPLDADPLEA
jgi:hypothetical protein